MVQIPSGLTELEQKNSFFGLSNRENRLRDQLQPTTKQQLGWLESPLCGSRIPTGTQLDTRDCLTPFTALALWTWAFKTGKFLFSVPWKIDIFQILRCQNSRFASGGEILHRKLPLYGWTKMAQKVSPQNSPSFPLSLFKLNTASVGIWPRSIPCLGELSFPWGMFPM